MTRLSLKHCKKCGEPQDDGDRLMRDGLCAECRLTHDIEKEEAREARKQA